MKRNWASELRAIAEGRLMLNVRNGVTVSRSMLAKIADELEAQAPALSTITPAEVGGLVAELRDEDFRHEMQHLRSSSEIDRLFQAAASLIQSQAARIAELEAGLEAIAVFPNPPTVSQARARALLNKGGRV